MTEAKTADQKKIEELERELGLDPRTTVAKLDRELGNTKLRVDPDSLTPRDMRRARDVLKGRNPFELMDDPLDRVVLTIWCLVSRSDPSFTWDQAEDMPFAMLQTDSGGEEEVPPPTAPTSSNGSRRGKTRGRASGGAASR